SSRTTITATPATSPPPSRRAHGDGQPDYSSPKTPMRAPNASTARTSPRSRKHSESRPRWSRPTTHCSRGEPHEGYRAPEDQAVHRQADQPAPLPGPVPEARRITDDEARVHHET